MAETVKLADEATADLPEGFKITELGPLPEDWQVVPLAMVAVIGGSKVNLSPYEPIPFIPMSLIPEDLLYITNWELRMRKDVRSGIPVREGDLLLAKITPCLENGKQGIVKGLPNGWGYASTEVYPIRTLDSLDIEFLALYLKHEKVRHMLASKMEGTTGRQRLPKAVLEAFPIPLPPVHEQRIIASVLRTVQRAKEATEKVLAAVRELKTSLMKHLFTYGPVPVEAAERVPLKETEIGPVPPNWEVAAFEDAFVGTARAPKVKRSDYRPVGRVPVIDQGKDFIAGFVDNVEPYQGTLPVIVFGDHTRIFKFVDFPFVVGADGTKVLIPNYNLFEPRFLFYALTRVDLPSRGYNRHFHLLREVSLPCPPLHEQRKIVCILQAVDRKIEAEKQRMAALDVLFKTLLHLLMTGRMRVKDLPLLEAEGVLPSASRE